MAAQLPGTNILKPPKVLVFDSGAGGLSIARTLLDLSTMPIKLSYLADNGAFPYGNKTRNFLIQRVEALMAEYIAKISPDIVVIACNTASTLVLPILRSRFDCPFVGTVPAIKPAAKLSKSGHIAVLATPATVEREYTNALIQTFAPDVKVLLYGSDNLVKCAEAYLGSQAIDTTLIKTEISKLLKLPNGDKIDTVVLACTHFPLIADQIKACAPGILNWVDSGDAVARRCLDLLEIPENRRVSEAIEHEISIWFSETGEARNAEAFERYLGK